VCELTSSERRSQLTFFTGESYVVIGGQHIARAVKLLYESMRDLEIDDRLIKDPLKKVQGEVLAYCGPVASKAKEKDRADKAIKTETDSTAKMAKEAAKRQRTADLTAARRGAAGKEDKTPKKQKAGKATGDEDGAGIRVDDSDEKE
jgi:hypothetical protein